jgi:ubiquinone/menaquinone biosynthesis C-methylase UbiE
MKINNKETYWSRFVEDYEDRQEYVAGKDLIQAVRERIRSENNLQHVLELGCGTGLFTEDLSLKATSVTATDFSDEMIAKALEIRKTLLNVSFSKEDAMQLSFRDQCFNSVFMANLIHIIADPGKVIAESRRVLKPGGRIIITSFAIDAMGFLNKIKMASRYIKTFGKVTEDARRIKTSPKAVEQLLFRNNFRKLKSELLGTVTKSMYIVALKDTEL